MPWGIAAIGGISSLIGSTVQAGAASSAAQDQEQAALAQLGLDASVFNTQGGMSLPTREAGGLAQSREAFLLGLTPNLDISPDFSVPTVNFNPSSLQTTAGWSGPAALDPTVAGATSGYGGYAASPTLAPSTAPTYQYPTGATAPGPNSFSLAGGGYSTVVGTPTGTPGSSYGFNYGKPTTGMPAGGANYGVPNPNASLPSSAYGSYATPYSPSTFFLSPDYNFLMSQGENTVQNQTAAEGNALSPAALAAALNYSSGLATTDYNQAFTNSLNAQAQQFNMLNALTTGGQVATSGLSTAASSAGAAGSSALAGYGNAGAAGAIGTGNAFSSGLNGLNNTALNAYNNSIYGGYNNPNNLAGAGGQMATYYDASGNPYQATVASGGFSTPS